MLEGESAPVEGESSWTEIFVVFFFGSNVKSGGRTRFCCLSFGRFGVAAVVVAITCREVENGRLPNICPPPPPALAT